MVGVAIGAGSAGGEKAPCKPVGGVVRADSAGGQNARAPGAQGPHEKTEGQGEFIGNKGVLVFDFAPGKAEGP